MKKLEKTIEALSLIFLCGMLVCCLLQVLFRFVIQVSVSFTEEFSRMFYIWMVFLMLPVLEARNEQLKVTYFFDKLPKKLRVVIYWGITFVYVIFLVILGYGSFEMIGQVHTLTFGSTAWLLMSYQYIPILLGSILGILFVIYRALHIKAVLQEAEDVYKV